MPSTYTHYKFANEVITSLPEGAKKAVEDNLTLYLIGCHGPDILFYYKAIKSNAVNRQGYAMHEESAAPFFERAKELVKKGGQPSLSYTMGFITHFALDSTCHGYVEDERKKLNITHTKLEVEFDRSLLVADGKNPVKSKLCGHICADQRYAGVIAPFFSLTGKQVARSLKDMKRICNLFVCPNGFKRGIVRCVLKMVSDDLPDQVMGVSPDPVCAESNKRMLELFESAKPVAKELFENFITSLEKKGLSERFNANYE